jgi:hypothetical protein
MKTRLPIQLGIAALVGTLLSAGPGAAAVATLSASKDNTIFSESISESEGSGGTFYVGRTGIRPGGGVRRALLAFDLGLVPAGAVVESVSLTLNLVTVPPAASTSPSISLHRVLKDWGEAGSSSGTGEGASAQPGDATWRYTSFSTAEWTNLGGDFESTESAALSVNNFGAYTWTSAGLAADVESWLDGSEGNFGWILVSDEQTTFSVRAFASRNNFSENARPVLTIAYTEAIPEPATVVMLLAGLALLLGLNRKRFT